MPPAYEGVSFAVTPISSTTAPYEFNVVLTATTSATIGNLFSYSIPVAWTGSTNGTGTFTGYYQVQCSVTNAHCPVVQIYDNDVKKVVSGSPAPTTSAVIGDQQNLVGQYLAKSGPAPSYTIVPTWTVAGKPITAYPLGVATAPTVSPTTTPMVTADLSKLSPTAFFWLTPGSNAITLDTVLNAELPYPNGFKTAYVNTQATYKVQAPTSISIGTSSVGGVVTQYTPAPNPSPQVLLTLYNMSSKNGIVFNFKATVPSGGAGVFDGLQLVKACRTFVESGLTYYLSTNDNMLELDNQQLYDTPAPTSGSWTDSDNPTFTLVYDAETASLNATDSFRHYMLYKPDGVGAGAKNSVWVPLGYLSWAWNGIGTQNPVGKWTATGASPSPTSESGVGVLPTWKAVLLNSSGTQTASTTANC